VMVLCQDVVIEPIEPILIRPRPYPIDTTSAKPRIIPKT
jgi:hypothetical protein